MADPTTDAPATSCGADDTVASTVEGCRDDAAGSEAEVYRAALAELVATMERMDTVDPYTVGEAIGRAKDVLAGPVASVGVRR